MLSQALIAIQLIHPNFSEEVVHQYAESIDQQAIVAGIDSLSFVAVIERESKFKSNVISPDGLDFGLCQIRSTYYKGNKWWLLNPTHNIAVGANIVKQNVDMCARHLGRMPRVSQWYSCYNGSCGKRSSFCVATANSYKVEHFRNCIANVVSGNANIKTCKSIYN
jgi:hypothetical protein